MKKLFTLMALSVFSFFGVQAQDANPNAAEITFEEKTIDYGTIEQGANGKREFKFTNTGKEPLIISNARGSCGCTVPTWPKEPIAPGETGVIKVKYDTNRVGPFQKTVTLTTNSTKRQVVLTIKGKVTPKPKENTAPVKKGKSKVAM